MPNRISVLFILLAVGSMHAAVKPATLVRNGRSAYTIVLSRNASPSEKHGAAELQHFLQEMSGALLPIRTEDDAVKGKMLLVGRSRIVDSLHLGIPFDKLGAEGFALKTAGPHLVIAGGRLRGTMYGVYDFLEKLGCRWVAADASRIPKTQTILVPPLDETQTPAFEYRDVYIAEAWDKDWAARNRLNGMMARLDASTGGKIEYYPFVHTFYQLIPPSKYFKDHPEYFALVDGKRRSDHAQLCLTNPDVLRLAVQQVLRWIKEHPSATIFSISQMDSAGECECDNCRRVKAEEGGASSGPILRFVNAIAEQVEKKYPDKLIDTLAYAYTEEPPAITRPRHNVRIRICPIGACQAHPYEKCPYDAYIVKNLKQWARITSQLYIWHYNANFSHFLLPMPDFDELAADIGMYKRNGVVGLFMEGSGAPGGDSAQLRAYVLSRLLWNPKADVAAAIDEFYQIYYSHAARSMRKYFDLLQYLVRMPPEGEGQHLWCCRAPVFTDSQMDQARAAFREALAAADNDVIRRRVERAQLTIRYVDLQRSRQFVLRDGLYRPVGLEHLRQQFEPFISDLHRLGIDRLGEEHDLKHDRDAIASTIRTYRAITIQSAALRLDIVPELHGRVVHMIDKRTGRELLNQPNPVETAYPDRSGWSVSVYPEYFAPGPLAMNWRLESSTGREITLVAKGGSGLTLRRTIRLVGDEPTVHATTAVENHGQSAVEAILQSQFDADPGRLEGATARFVRRSGGVFERRLILPVTEPAGAENFADSTAPDGEWQITGQAAGVTLINRFASAQVARCNLSWNGKNQNRASMILWSPRRTLAPGESLHLDTTFDVR